jgi:hypothetical protein
MAQKQVTYTAFKMAVDTIPNPEGGDPIRNLVVHTPTEVLVFPCTDEAAKRVADEFTEKRIVTPSAEEAAQVLRPPGDPSQN